MRGERIVRALERAGFKVARVAGSRHIMRHPDGRGTTVPVHPGRDVAKGEDSKNRLGVVRRLPQMFKWETRVVQGIQPSIHMLHIGDENHWLGYVRGSRPGGKRAVCRSRIRPSNGESDCREKHLGMTIVDHHAADFTAAS